MSYTCRARTPPWTGGARAPTTTVTENVERTAGGRALAGEEPDLAKPRAASARARHADIGDISRTTAALSSVFPDDTRHPMPAWQ